HDLSEGGLGVAAAEMAFAGRRGASIDLRTVPLGVEVTRDDVVLFSESNSRFLVEISPEDRDEFEKRLRGLPCAHIGQVESTDRLVVVGLSGTTIVDSSLVEIGRAWQGPMDW
ncbi:MAG: AIR synthase-related protein, partial [Chloroflexota bacterium]